MTKKRTAVLISGNGSNLQALIDHAQAPDYPAEITLVISNNTKAYGLKRAEEAGIATRILSHRDFANRDVFDDALHQALVEANVELVCLAGFMRLLTPGFTTAWEGRMLNIHPSLLPAFKGLNTHERVLEFGSKVSGCSVHFVSPEMDAGPVVIQAAVPVKQGDTPDTLATRIHAAEHRIYPQALAWLAADKLRIIDGKVHIEGGYDEPDSMINPPAETL